MQHGGHEHMQHDDGGMQHDSFMSMIMMTSGLPRSRDGLPMEDYEARFGPDHPAVAPGTVLHLTLDGDTVRSARFSAEKTAKLRSEADVTPAIQDIEWLVRFMDVLGHAGLSRISSELYRAYRAQDIEKANKLLSTVKRSIRRNPLIRWRLKGLAEYAGSDAYDRLTDGLDDIRNELADIDKVKNGKTHHAEFVVSGIVTDRLEGLELAQALVAAASFRVVVSKGEQS